VSLDSYEFGAEARLSISNRGADGYVILDAIQVIAVGKRTP
jgi:hypothetical protein